FCSMSTRRAFFNSKMFLICQSVPPEGGFSLRPGVEPSCTKLVSVVDHASLTPGTAAGDCAYTVYSLASATGSQEIRTAPPLTVAVTSSDRVEDASLP